MTGTTTFKDRALRAIAILGLIAILLLGAWGIIQIAFTLYGFLGASTPSPTHVTQTTTEQVTVAVPSAITSGVPFTLSFAHQNANGNYAYSISYSCVSGLELQAPLPTGKTQAVPCNTPFNYTNATANMQLTATLTGMAQVQTTFSVAAKNLATNVTSATGTATAAILPAAATKPATTTTTPAKTSSSTYVAAKHTTSMYGLSDLMVSTGAAVNQGNGRYSVTFTIQNVGTNVSPSNWTFNASLPTSPTYTYNSNAQQALYPGDKIVYTLGFTMQNTNYGYGYNNNQYNYGTSYPTYPANCGYTNNYTYNGAYTYPDTSYGCNTGNSYTYPYTTSPYSYGSSYYPTYSYGNSLVTITVDPNGYVSESNKSNKSNNQASVSVSY